MISFLTFVRSHNCSRIINATGQGFDGRDLLGFNAGNGYLGQSFVWRIQPKVGGGGFVWHLKDNPAMFFFFSLCNDALPSDPPTTQPAASVRFS